MTTFTKTTTAFERKPSMSEKYNFNNHQQQQSSVYDESLPKNEYKYMKFIRRWEKQMGFVTPLKWTNIILLMIFHVVAIVYTWRCFLLHKWQTDVFGVLTGLAGGFGITAGVHRYWTHRSYKAKRPLRIILALCFSMAGQYPIFNWVRDHRVHHKFSETPADPHNINRGFFFSHVGWFMMVKHPDVIKQGTKIDMSDIKQDPIVQFHDKYFITFKLMACIVLPTLIPMLAWGENWDNAFSFVLMRYMLLLNFTWCTNSFAHMWGDRPYDRNIKSVENWAVSFVAMGEGWHNYHHTFPWDYKASELPYFINITTFVIDRFAKIGWAYDMKQASPSLVQTVSRNR